jgi:hypothetical protein
MPGVFSLAATHQALEGSLSGGGFFDFDARISEEGLNEQEQEN